GELMARHWFGQSLTDWTMILGDETESEGVKLRPAITAGPVTVTLWDSATGGTQYTDLLDASGAPIAHVVTADGPGKLQVGPDPRERPGGDDRAADQLAGRAGARRRVAGAPGRRPAVRVDRAVRAAGDRRRPLVQHGAMTRPVKPYVGSAGRWLPLAGGPAVLP